MSGYNGRDGNGYQPLPDPPPMRVGTHGDTVDKHGVRRKSDGTLRTWYLDIFFGWIPLLVVAGCVVALVVAMSR